MSSNAWLRVMACLVVGSFTAGCDGPKLCRPCEREAETVETVKVDVDWQELADALKEIQPAGQGGTTVRTDSINVTISADQPDGERTITIADWDKMVEALSSIQGCADCETAAEAPKIHHSTFTFRFAPPWFNSDLRSLFTSYVVFPEEAKLDEWLGRKADEGCRKDGQAPSSICPDTVFYRKAMGPFLKGLSQCGTKDKKVELHTVGFASSTRLNNIEEGSQRATDLEKRYDQHIGDRAKDCLGERTQPSDSSDRFNLLVANQRAANAAAMLRELVPEKAKDLFDIKPRSWCSHAGMEGKRHWDDQKDPTIGLVNRRAEVHVVELPRCVDIDPDNWLGKTD